MLFQTTAKKKNALQSDMTVKVTCFSFILTVNWENLSIIVHSYIQELANPLVWVRKDKKGAWKGDDKAIEQNRR